MADRATEEAQIAAFLEDRGATVLTKRGRPRGVRNPLTSAQQQAEATEREAVQPAMQRETAVVIANHPRFTEDPEAAKPEFGKVPMKPVSVSLGGSSLGGAYAGGET